MPRVSVVMAVFNGERFLRQAVDSILNQTYPDFEFIIIDDGSTDGTAEILEAYSDPRLRVRAHRNVGLITSLNRGLGMARGEYIARMDADDISLPRRLAAQLNFLDAHPEVGVLGCAAQVMDAHGNKSLIWRYPAEHGVLRWSLCFHDPIVHSTVMMRQEVVARVAGYSSDMVHVEDYDLWRRLSRLTRLCNLQDVLLDYREHEASVTSTGFVEQWHNSTKTSQLMMCETLGEDVPMSTVHHLCSREFSTLDDVRQAANLIHRLYQASVTDSALSVVERRLIRRDAARRLFGVALQRIGDVHVWEVVGLACRLDPLVAPRGATAQLRRMLHEPLLA